MDDELQIRKSLTFDEAEGLVELPQQLEVGQLSNPVKAKMWDIVYILINKYSRNMYSSLGSPMYEIARSHWIDVRHGMADEFDPEARVVAKNWKAYFLPHAKYNETLGFVQWLVRQLPSYLQEFAEAFADILEKGRVAYRLVDGDTIVPVASKEEADVVSAALIHLAHDGKVGAREHLRAAASHLSEGNFADSVRESIHAVESLVRSETGESSLSGALKKMSDLTPMHEAFKKALGNLYGYSSDQQGIRHPLLDRGDANVTERDALFMLGVCASFVTYLASYKSSPQG